MTEESDRMKKAAPETPVVGERNATSLKKMLMPSTLPPIPDPRPSGCYTCAATRCVMCHTHLVSGNSFTSHQTGETFHHRHVFSCTSSNIVYLLWCSKCPNSQYVGETKTPLKQRFYKHYDDIRQDKGTHVTRHFNQPGHSVDNVKCMVIEQNLSHPDNTAQRRRREFFWMTKLRTIYPLGLNSKD
jgi:hypothetical protein